MKCDVKMPGNSFRLLEHTADMGIEAHGGSCEEVLLAIARGLANLIYGDSPVAALVSVNIRVCAEDPVELLVNWLNEVCYRCERDNLVPAAYRIESIVGGELKAVVFAEPFDPERHVIERQVKSVTYHQACLERVSTGWHARVYVDL